MHILIICTKLYFKSVSNSLRHFNLESLQFNSEIYTKFNPTNKKTNQPNDPYHLLRQSILKYIKLYETKSR